MSRVIRLVHRVLLLLALGVVVLAPASPLMAQTEEELKEARKQFHQALELEQAGNWAGALRLFREVGQIKMTPQVRFHIALCEENLGKLVAALGGYELALADADSVGPAFSEEVQGNVEQLRARIPKLVIERGEGAEAATIELDGIELGSSSIGVEVPVDPGPHQVYATAKGYEDFVEAISVEEEGIETLVVEMKRITKPPPPPPPPPQPTAVPEQSKPRYVPVGLTAGGGVVMATGGVLLLLAKIEYSDVESECSGQDPCDIKYKDKYDKATTKLYVGWTGVGVGAAIVGTGLYLLLRPDSAQSDREKPSKDQDKGRKKRADKAKQPKSSKPSKAKKKASIRLVPAAPQTEAGFSIQAQF